MPSGLRIRTLNADDLPVLTEFLLQHGDSSMHMLANVRLGGIICKGEAFQAHYIAAFERSRLRGVIALGSNDMVLVQCPDPTHLTELVRSWREWFDGGAMGLIGPRAQVEHMALLLGGERLPFRLNNTEQMLSLDCAEVVMPERMIGEVRWSKPDDLEKLYGWRTACLHEALRLPLSEALVEQVRADVDGETAARHLAVLLDGDQLVACAQIAHEQDGLIKQGLVYVPPERRGQGLAKQMLAGLMQLSAARGVRRAVLFITRRHIEISRAALSVGFKPYGDFGVILFDEPVKPPKIKTA